MPALHPLPHTRTPAVLFPTPAAAAKYVAREIDKLVRARNAASKPTVLGLATGSTPVGLYRELIRLHKEEGLDLSRVVTFNLDEYLPMPRESQHSYFRWMHETLFNHVNIPWNNIHIPDGTLAAEEVDAFCVEYEKKIKAAGGIDVQILGIGRTGHIAFNEPGSPRNSRTRKVTLDSITRRDAASGFFGEENVPHQAITMGVASILDARRIFMMAYGEHKAGIVYKALEQPPTEAISASFLQEHPDATVILDEAAAAELTAIKRPWEVGPCDWTPDLVRKAVVHLALTVRKGLQKLNDDDFRDHHMYELLREIGPAERIGEEVFHDRMSTIRPHPAGRVVPPGSAPARRAGDGGPAKTILVFSPHPDDDVISMGGTIIRLVEQGHKVHVAYMTSGNIAVFDHDARRFVDFVDEFLTAFGTPERAGGIKDRVYKFLDEKQAGQPDSDEVLKVKGLIRATEARAAALACGIPPEQLEFMNLRFYQTGTKTKLPIQPQDVEDIAALVRRLRPAQIYVAGELSDPHGTHRMCAEAVFAAARQLRAAEPAAPPFDVWLYKGAWEEWEAHEIEMAVPLSPEVLERKKQAIFRHQSQKDKAMFPGGTDRREFWQRAEDRNIGTAKTYDALGLPEYFALEAFVKWKDA
ncbi:glucosamine-6-phosphate deaminase : Glucosamine-6-phosphate deaminase-like protein OS=Planctomyces maris DSM 8797 GN=PM8797T_00694 PE=4 SV=1: Glucosamine_iso: PIG-L [Gemmataceae bacterium]|nr:glucosamine-6-phosphate deaminase : Glucosamine-6-phosphate deaminase-like protein OS=Planctomyces maris DSM 8797 GN=PM8797T_00694 PE=4 SV=1: Glucosamine_iso: PIG-L [Gemmataceae bacterium]VTU02820.1 glucosamine-6-phosphate deaminase : Glucosamine-6-phosphate deaminase-like protein OS=Planctomyces maris DSM 8797 GN=PM8797T_00694 PE=4 SV=1: Glucosamine_iso: PIG-L [Gemmataceae bacterium]